MSSFSRFSRRDFLKGVGGSAALLPLLDYDSPARAAGTALFPKRLVVFSWTNGFVWNDLWPKGGTTDFTYGATLKPLEPYRADTLIIAGVGQRMHYELKQPSWKKDQWYGGHDGFPAIISGIPLSTYQDNVERSGGDSVDQYIAGKLETEQNVKVPFSSLVVGPIAEGGYGGTISYKGISAGITPESDPFKLYTKLFNGRSSSPAQFDTLLAEKKSIYDYLDKNLSSFKTRLGTEDQRKVDAHVDSIRTLEKQLDSLKNTPSSGCVVPSMGTAYNAGDVSKVPMTSSLFNQLIAASLRCDLTRVVTMNMSTAGGDSLVLSWLGSDFVGKGDEYPTRQFHDITHNAGKDADHTARKIKADAWFMQQAADFIALLKNTREGSGTMLDNTAVVITNAMGRNHDSWICPIIIVGSCGGYFKGGRYMKVGDMASNMNATKGLAHNGVLTALCNAMGTDGTKYGVADYAKELPGIRG